MISQKHRKKEGKDKRGKINIACIQQEKTNLQLL